VEHVSFETGIKCKMAINCKKRNGKMKIGKIKQIKIGIGNKIIN